MRNSHTPETNEARAGGNLSAGFENGNREHMECKMDDTTNHSLAQAGADAEGAEATHTGLSLSYFLCSAKKPDAADTPDTPETPEQKRQREACEGTGLKPIDVHRLATCLDGVDDPYIDMTPRYAEDTIDWLDALGVAPSLCNPMDGLRTWKREGRKPWQQHGMSVLDFLRWYTDFERRYLAGEMSEASYNEHRAWAARGATPAWEQQGQTWEAWEAQQLERERQEEEFRDRGRKERDRLSLRPQNSRPSLRLISPSRTALSGGVEWLVPNFIPTHGIGFIAGAPGSHKTGLGLAMGVALATGGTFAGYTASGPRWALHIAWEGGKGIPNRFTAALCYYAPDAPEGALPMRVVVGAPLIVEEPVKRETYDGSYTHTPEPGTSLVKSIRDMLRHVIHGSAFDPGMIVLDTVSAGLGSHNIIHEAPMVVTVMQKLHDEFGATVLAITHPPKGGEGMAGGFQQIGGADFVLSSRMNKAGEVELRVEKMKDKERSKKVYRFQPTTHILDEDKQAPVLDYLGEYEDDGGAPTPKPSGAAPVKAPAPAESGETRPQAPAPTRARWKAKGGASKPDPKREAVRTALAYSGEAGTTAREIEKATGRQITHSTADRHIKALVASGEAARGEDGKYRLAGSGGLSEAA